jgi:outer membrane lipoprotein-sorting protein
MERARTRVAIIFSFLLLLWGSCARHPEVDLEYGPVRGPQDIIKRVNANAARLKTLRAEVRFNSPQIPQGRFAKATVIFAQPDRYRVKFSALFGRTMALLLVDRGEASLYLPLDNRLYQGWLDAEQMDQLLGVDSSLLELLEGLVGAVRVPAVTDLLDYRITDVGYWLSFRWQGSRQEIQVASDGLKVLEVTYFDDFDRPRQVRSYQHHRMIADVLRPGGVDFDLPTRGERMELTFVHQEVNPQVDEAVFRLNLPDSVERVRLIPE